MSKGMQFHKAVRTGLVQNEHGFRTALVFNGSTELTGVSSDGYHELRLMLTRTVDTWRHKVWVKAEFFTPSMTSDGMRTQHVEVVVAIEDNGTMTPLGIIVDDVFIECVPCT